MPTVMVPTAYRGPTKGEGEIAVDGETVRACLEAVEAQYPGFLAQVIDAGGAIHRFVKLFKNEDQLDPVEALSVTVEVDDRVEVLAAIGGG